MICPLLLVAIELGPQPGISDARCRREECAWWEACSCTCAVLIMAQEVRAVVSGTASISVDTGH